MANPNPGSLWQDHNLSTQGHTHYPLSHCGKSQDVIQVTLDFFSCCVWIAYTEDQSEGLIVVLGASTEVADLLPVITADHSWITKDRELQLHCCRMSGHTPISGVKAVKSWLKTPACIICYYVGTLVHWMSCIWGYFNTCYYTYFSAKIQMATYSRSKPSWFQCH